MNKFFYSYDDIHRAIAVLADKIRHSGQDFDLMLAIGGGGLIPARILRSFLNIPVYSVTLAYYDAEDRPTDCPQKVQWLDEAMAAKLRGKRVLVVDEVDDSRVTLAYCLNELKATGIDQLGVAVLHEKQKTKQAELPPGLPYFSAITVGEDWIVYPWDATDIDAHNRDITAQQHVRTTQ